MDQKPVINRRSFLSSGAAAVAGALAAPSALAQSQRLPLGPEPSRYPSSVWKVLDPRFSKYMIGNTPLIREWTGALWAEGPAWNGVGRYVVFSDIPNNVQLRWDEATGKVTTLRSPSNFSNGNTSTGRDDRFRASTRPRASSAMSTRARRPCSRRPTKASA
jgi:gluconolactonase